MAVESEAAAGRAKRSDGVATRTRILAVALVAFAKHGYGHVSSKDICVEAEVNSAAINYYFGSYDQLYIEVMREAHEQFLRRDRLDLALAEGLSPLQRIERLIEVLVAEIADQPWYYGHLWLRESMSPNQQLMEHYRKLSNYKRDVIMQLLAEYLGVERGDILVNYSFLSFFSPFMLILLKQSSLVSEYGLVSGLAKQDLIDHIRRYALAGLDAIRPQPQ